MSARTPQPVQPAPDNDLLICDYVAARPLDYSLSDYHKAMSDGPLNFTWRDKPHRLIYDLIAAVKWYAASQPVQPAAVPVAVCDPYEKAKDGVYGPEYESQFSAQPAQPAIDDFHIQQLALANGFKLKEQPDGAMALNPYVFAFSRALLDARPARPEPASGEDLAVYESIAARYFAECKAAPPSPLTTDDYQAIRAQLCEAHPGDWLHHYGPAVEAEVLRRLAPGYVRAPA